VADDPTLPVNDLPARFKPQARQEAEDRVASSSRQDRPRQVKLLPARLVSGPTLPPPSPEDYDHALPASFRRALQRTTDTPLTRQLATIKPQSDRQ